MKKLSVLLIEDDILDVEAIERAFRLMEPQIFELRTTARLLDAIGLIKSKEFHVVLLDLGLPDSTGLGSINRLMELVPHIPVIVLTGNDDADLAIRGIELGAQEFLTKAQLTSADLLRTIRHAAKRKQVEMNAILSRSSDAKRMANLLQETSHDILENTDRLMETKLDANQRRLVDRVKKQSRQSLDAVRKLNERLSGVSTSLSPPSGSQSQSAGGSQSQPEDIIDVESGNGG
ncbi:MAG: response regulator [Planctomycetota bacterium]